MTQTLDPLLNCSGRFLRLVIFGDRFSRKPHSFECIFRFYAEDLPAEDFLRRLSRSVDRRRDLKIPIFSVKFFC